MTVTEGDKVQRTKVFVSYSRKDMTFIDRLEAALEARGVEALIDRREIYAFEDWWKRVEALIVQADTVIFVLSPDAVASEVALKEITFAASLNKRFAPIVCRRVPDQAVPEPLARLNFIFFDDEAQFDASADRLAEALATDLEWVRKHTEFGEAARRWTVAGRPGPRGLLLRSPVLEEAERWIASRPEGAPVPTEETQSFIAQSRRAAIRRRTILTSTLAAGLLIALGLAGFAYWQRGVAQRNAEIAAKNERKATENEVKARKTLSGSDFFRADELIASGKPPEAMAFLARAIRVDPQNHAAARRALMLLQEQPWFLPEPWLVPERFQIKDVRFLDCRRVIFMVSDKTGIGFCDESGRLLYPMRQRDGDGLCGLSEDGRLYFTDVTGKPRQYRDVRDGTPQPAPASAREGPESDKLRKAIANELRLGSSDAERIVISPLGAKAAVPMTDMVLVVRTSPLALLDSVLAKDLSGVLAFDPVTDGLVQVGGSHDEYGHDGFVSIPARSKRFDLTDQCMAVRFFPAGRMFVTEQLGGMLNLWDIGGSAFGEVVPASESAREVEFEKHGLDVAPDGRAIVSPGCRLRAIGRLPIARRSGDNPADRELANLQEADVQDPRVTVPQDEVEMESGAPKKPHSPKPIEVERRNPDQKIVLEASEGFDSGEWIAGHVVCARSADGSAAIWNGTTGKRLKEFNVGAGGSVRATTKDYVVVEFDGGCELWRLDPPRRIGRRLQVSDLHSFDVHPGGTRLLISKEYWVEGLDTTTGEPVGDRCYTTMKFSQARFAPDGSYFVTECNNSGSNDVEYRLWDTATLRPLSRPISSREILAHAAIDGARAYFDRDDRIYLCAAEEEGAPRDIYYSFDIPPDTKPVPGWLASLLEAVCGRRVAESNALVDLPTEERHRRIAATRELVAKADLADTFAAIVRWWLDEDPARVVSPRSTQSVADYLAKRLAAGTMLDLALAAHAAPDNAAVVARIAALHRTDSAEAQADGDSPRSAEVRARADHYSRLALRLTPAPHEPEVNAPVPAHANPSPPAAPGADAEAHFARAEVLRKSASKINPDALALYREAAELGHAAAMHRIGVAYALGEGVPKDAVQAVEWYRKAAEKGFAEAQYDLGVRYIMGLGVPKNEPIGLEWYRKAAAQGWQKAIEMLRQHERAATHK